MRLTKYISVTLSKSQGELSKSENGTKTEIHHLIQKGVHIK